MEASQKVIESVNLKTDELWSRFQSGDKDAFQTIYQSRVDRLYNYGLKICSQSLLVKDCIQDLFIDLWTKRQNLSSSVNIDYYLFKSLRRKIISELNKDKKREQLHIDRSVNLDDGQVKSEETKLIWEQYQSEQKVILKTAINKLPDRQREVVFLLFYSEFSYEESASIMNVDVKTAYNLSWRAMKQLRNVLK